MGFVRWAYFGSHSRDLVHDEGTASESAYHLLHRQEQEAEGRARPYRSDNWVVGYGDDGRWGMATPVGAVWLADLLAVFCCVGLSDSREEDFLGGG